MKIFLQLISYLSAVPDWVGLIVCPALALLSALLTALFGGRKFYPAAAVFLGAFGALAVLASSDAQTALAYACLFVMLSALCTLFFLIPKRKKKEGKKESRVEKMYRKFHQELHLPRRIDPPKECCFKEEEPCASAEESGACLAHADGLIAKLRAAKLSAGDRLQVEETARTIDGYRSRPLTESELGLLNDCLASILKLTAKYKL